MKFSIVDNKTGRLGRKKGKENLIILYAQEWFDYYVFKTAYDAVYYGLDGERYELGTVKIGKAHMHCDTSIVDYLDSPIFGSLPDGFFSLWQTAEAYRRVLECEKKYNVSIVRNNMIT